MKDKNDLRSVLHEGSALQDNFLAELRKKTYIKGRLSGSALAGAVALTALKIYGDPGNREIIHKGVKWIADNQNRDGGFGDSTESISNLSTSLLCLGALRFCSDKTEKYEKVISALEKWISSELGVSDLKPDIIAEVILRKYGRDRTFSVPIVMMLGICGLLGNDFWRLVPQFPFELTALPRSLYKWLRLPVVSYALPALMSIGIARFVNFRKGRGLLYSVRERFIPGCLERLIKMQPESGGYLEAVPLTGFVCMCLCAGHFQNEISVKKGIAFLVNLQRADGSWPVDIDLSAWLTSLCSDSLNLKSCIVDVNSPVNSTGEWILNNQFKERHPFTDAASGGWGWTDHSGSVPDADDTSGALIALYNFHKDKPEYIEAAKRGIRWLRDVQNRDGGIPTFCKGWGKFPFDRSCPDITAHALRAVYLWNNTFYGEKSAANEKFVKLCIMYLKKSQQADGSWIPLWFGNQWADNMESPVYGTARVISALKTIHFINRRERFFARSLSYLETMQNIDGGWGNSESGESTVEETAVALTALTGLSDAGFIEKGFDFLYRKTSGFTQFKAEPVGLYFAALWYSEEAYPSVFTLRALKELENSRDFYGILTEE